MSLLKGVAIGLVLIFLMPLAAWGDGAFFPVQHPVTEPEQLALLAYDGGRETMLLQVSFQSWDGDLAWIVPLPSPPLVEEGPDGVFAALADLTQPLVLWDERLQETDQWRQTGPVSLGPKGSEGVEVLDRRRVGLLDTTTLAARTSDELVRWLRENGFPLPEAASAIFADYVQRGWVFLAMRLDMMPLLEENSTHELMGLVQPVLLRFDAPGLVYPLRISSLNSDASAIVLYIAGRRRAEADGFAVRWAHQVGVEDLNDPALYSFWNVYCPTTSYLTCLSATLFPWQMGADLLIRQAPSDQPFRQVTANTSHWSAGYLQAMAERFVLRAFPDGGVWPDRACGRAEGVAMLTRALGLERTTVGTSFPDVGSDYWAGEEVAAAQTEKLVEGYPSGEFRPEEPITRAEWLTMLLRAFPVLLEFIPYDPLFLDVTKSHWAFRTIQTAGELGIVIGYPDGRFQPDGEITRAEVCAVLSRTILRMP
ncbi:MAG: DUF2330 domain-containing protein [bacterium]